MRPGLVPVEPSPVSVVTTIAVTTTTAPSVAPTTVRPVVVHAATSTTTVPRVAHTHATTTIPSSIGNPGPAVTPTDDVWARLAQCESGMRNLRNPPYSGYFQFLPSTFRAMGGTGGPADHTYEEQKAVAIRLQARSGWGQWPGCSRKLGLT